MLQSFFNGLSGLFSFSRGLNTISNNIANMNTPGFRGNDSFFRSINGSNGGFGTSLTDTNIRLSAGEIRQTSEVTDLALNGSGFFVLRDDQGELFYTRAGQFRFNQDGILIDIVTKYEVMALDDFGNLRTINISSLRTRPAEATTSVNILGTLYTGPGTGTGTTPTVNNIRVFDAGGDVHNLTMTMTSSAAGQWAVAVTDESGATVGTGNIRYAADNMPLAGFEQITIALPVGTTTQNIVFNFGTPGTLSGTRQSASTATSISATVVDGHAVLGMSSLSFDEKGQIKLTYSNGDKEDGDILALASFSDEGSMTQASGSLYRATDAMPAEYGHAAEGVFGKVQGNAIELSNVDLTQEFADMMIIQRGYQASSRVMSVSNEMVEQLYNSTRGG